MSVLSPGTIVGRDFRVVNHLASGAMGAVYIVDQLSTGKQRAMKVMSHELVVNDRARERFVLEARVGAKVDSDHVVEVVTAGVDEGSGMPYLVMELLRGEELSDKVQREGALPLGQVGEILKQVGHALEKAHAQGIVHRDLKPENIFIAESRREGVPFTAKILDFGIAKLVAERTSEGTQPIGTPLFMAPEQTDKRGQIGPASDVWPLGLIAFYLLTGKHYWIAAYENITTLLREVVLDPIAPASERAQQMGVGHVLPPGFDPWFARCVTRNPAERFPEAGSAVRAFQEMVLRQAPSLSTGPLPQASSIRIGTGPHPLSAAESTGATVMAEPALLPGGGSTGMVAAATAAPTATKSKAAPILVGVSVLAVAGVVGFYFASRPADGSASLASSATTAEPAPSASESAAPAAAACPDGMVKIDGGNMFMGSTDDDLADDVRPAHKVKVSSFCLDKLEVTAEAYDGCTKAGNCLRAPDEVKFEGVTPEQVKAFSPLCNTGKADREDHPINCVDWSMADAFCNSEGGRLKKGGARLPTEAEWEFAARGSGQRVYPWGDDPPGSQASQRLWMRSAWLGKRRWGCPPTGACTRATTATRPPRWSATSRGRVERRRSGSRRQRVGVDRRLVRALHRCRGHRSEGTRQRHGTLRAGWRVQRSQTGLGQTRLPLEDDARHALAWYRLSLRRGREVRFNELRRCG